MNKETSLVLRNHDAVTEENGLIWKTIAVEGDYKVASVNNKLVNETMRFVAEGESDPNTNQYSLTDIKNSFDRKAYQKVTVPLDHRNRVHENKGWVKDVVFSEDSRGRKCLKAGFQIDDAEIRGQIQKGLIADVSMGLKGNYRSGLTGEVFPVALNHVCLTNVPVLQDLDGFEMTANFSEDTEDVDVYYFDEVGATITAIPDTPQITEAQIADNAVTETPEVREKTSEHDLRDLKIALLKQFSDVPYIYDVSVKGYIDNVALVSYTKEDKRYDWAIPFEVKSLDDGETQLYTYSKVSFDTINSIEEEVLEETAPVVQEVPRELTTREILQQAQAEREQRVANLSETTGEISTNMPDINFSELDETTAQAVREALAAKDAEISKYTQKQKEATVDNKLTYLSEDLGLKEYPGLLSYVGDIYTQDNDKPAAVINFSESEDGEVALTATEILDGFIERLPKREDGTVNLSEQALQSQEGKKPANDTSGENETAAEGAAAIREALGKQGFDFPTGA